MPVVHIIVQTNVVSVLVIERIGVDVQIWMSKKYVTKRFGIIDGTIKMNARLCCKCLHTH